MKMSNLINVKSSQLSVFNYADIAKQYSQETADQLESLEHEGTGILLDAKIKFGNVLKKGKELVEHGDFTKWYSAIWGLSQQRVSDFINVAKAHAISPESGDLFPEKLRSASTMAKAILNAPEEKREELVEDLKQEKETKGKDLTEAQIKKLAEKYLKEKEEQIQELREQVKEAKQGELFFQQKLDEKMSEVNSLVATIENQNKQIKELNSSISIKEQKLIDLSQKERELEEKEQLLAEQENSLNETIDDEVNNKLERLKQQELSNIEEEKQRLKDEQKKIQQELRKQKELAEALENQKQKFNDVRDWLKKIEDFNETLKNRSINIISTIKDIQNLPSFEQLGEDQRKVLFPRFSSAMNEFEKNSEAWGKAIQNIYSALNKADKQVINLINAPIDVEVKE